MAVEVQSRPGPGSPADLPRMFGSYLLLERIGRGGMAEIFLAHAENELGASRSVAVKQMLPEYSSDPLFAQSLISEAKLASGLSHHNIVRVLDLGRETGRLYIAMEYVEGFDLNQLLGRLSRSQISLPVEFAIYIARAVLGALDYAHRAVDRHGAPLGIVHRDVSPANVLISLEGEIRLCDFGIARAYASEPMVSVPASRASAGIEADSPVAVAGKLGYMSPEHALGQAVDARSDVFAAGVLLWELCAGRRMFRNCNPVDGPPVTEQLPAPELPERGLPDAPRLQAILRRALAFHPDDRYQSAQELLEALENYALSMQLMGSELRFGAFLSQHFGADFAELRRVRERVARRERASPPSAAAGRATAKPTAREPVPPPLAVRKLNPAQLRPRHKRPLFSGSALVVLLTVVYWLATH